MEDMDELRNRKRKWTVRESLGFFEGPSNHQPHPEREERKRERRRKKKKVSRRKDESTHKSGRGKETEGERQNEGVVASV